MVEPGGNALRSAEVGEGERLLISAPGRSGCSRPCSRWRRLRCPPRRRHGVSREFAATLGVAAAWLDDDLLDLRWDAVIDAPNLPASPARAAALVDAGRRIVYLGLSETSRLLDTRTLAMKDVTAVAVLSASPGLTGVIDLFATGLVDPRPLVAATTVTLEDVGAVLHGERLGSAGSGPEIHVDPPTRRQQQ